MKWALANEKRTGGKWSKIVPVVDVQDARTGRLVADLSDEHLNSHPDPSFNMSRKEVQSITDRPCIQCAPHRFSPVGTLRFSLGRPSHPEPCPD